MLNLVRAFEICWGVNIGGYVGCHIPNHRKPALSRAIGRQDIVARRVKQTRTFLFSRFVKRLVRDEKTNFLCDILFASFGD